MIIIIMKIDLRQFRPKFWTPPFHYNRKILGTVTANVQECSVYYTLAQYQENVYILPNFMKELNEMWNHNHKDTCLEKEISFRQLGLQEQNGHSIFLDIFCLIIYFSDVPYFHSSIQRVEKNLSLTQGMGRRQKWPFSSF